MMAQLYNVAIHNINQHIKTIFSEGELLPESTIKNFTIVQKEGSRSESKSIEHYNLQMIILPRSILRNCGKKSEK